MSPGPIIVARMLAEAPSGGFWLPAPLSTTAGKVDSVFFLILWICLFFFALVLGVMILFILRYRQRPGHEQPQPSPVQSVPLEIAWTLVPAIAVVTIFGYGARNFLRLTTPPANAYEIRVVAQSWQWLFTYPNGYVDGNLHVPVDVPVELSMTSTDMIHGLYIPAFRVKQDVLPGRYTHVWFRATAAGEQDLFCSQYCGTGHSQMQARVIVHPPGGFEEWLATAAGRATPEAPVAAGARYYFERGCAQCHSRDGSSGVGPTLKGLYGQSVRLSDGRLVVADDDYIRESILDPLAKIVVGYQPTMPAYTGRLSDPEVTALIAYIKTLR